MTRLRLRRIRVGPHDGVSLVLRLVVRCAARPALWLLLRAVRLAARGQGWGEVTPDGLCVTTGVDGSNGVEALSVGAAGQTISSKTAIRFYPDV